MSELAYYRIGLFEFIFTDYDIDNSIFNVFNIDNNLIEVQDDNGFTHTYLKTDVLKARRRFNLKCHISVKEIEELYKNTLNECYRVTSYFEDKDYSEEEIERVLKKDFSFDKYISSINELFTLANSNNVKTFLEKNRFEKDFKKEAKTKFATYINKSVLNSLLFDSYIDQISSFAAIDDMLLLENIKSSNHLLKTLLMALPDEMELIYELSYLISSESLSMKDIKKKDDSIKTLIITEGSTDYNYLKPMINYLMPEFNDCFAFMPLEGIDSGTSYAVKYYKMLKNANLKRNILFIFDNDLAGKEAFESLPRKRDEYIKAIQLPDYEEFKSYPCISFDGEIVEMDINGKAVSIEMVFPDSCLQIDGKLSPIRWTGYNRKFKAYQGSLEEKNKVQKQIELFLKRVSIKTSDCSFNRLLILINSMIDAFKE